MECPALNYELLADTTDSLSFDTVFTYAVSLLSEVKFVEWFSLECVLCEHCYMCYLCILGHHGSDHHQHWCSRLPDAGHIAQCASYIVKQSGREVEKTQGKRGQLRRHRGEGYTGQR